MGNADMPISPQPTTTKMLDSQASSSIGTKGTPSSSFSSLLKATNKRGSVTGTENKKGTALNLPAASLSEKLSSLQSLLMQVDSQLTSRSGPLNENEQSLKKSIESLLAQFKDIKQLPDSQLNQTLVKLNSLIDTVKKESTKADQKQSNDSLGSLLAMFQVLQPILKAVTDQLGSSPTVKGSLGSVTRFKPVTATSQKKPADLSVGSLPTNTRNDTQQTPLIRKITQALASPSVPLKQSVQPSIALKIVDKGVALPQQKEGGNDSTRLTPTLFIGGQQEMGKVQQFLFRNGTTAVVPNVSQQLENQIKTWLSQGVLKANNGQMSINLQLNPKNLGSIQLSINQTDNGLTAFITAHSLTTKDLIDSQLNHLQQALAGSGISVQKLEVALVTTAQQTSDPSNQQPQQQDGGSNNQSNQQPYTKDEDTVNQQDFEDWLNNEVISV